MLQFLACSPELQLITYFYSKAFSLNNCLKTLCREQGVELVDMWNDFYNQRGFGNDGRSTLVRRGGGQGPDAQNSSSARL